MRRAALALALCLTVGVVPRVSLAAEPPPGAPPLDATGISENLAQLNATVGELVRLVRRQVEQQDLMIVVQRMQMASFLLIEVSRTLDDHRRERESYAESLERMETEQRVLAEAARPSPGEPESERPDAAMLAIVESEMTRMRGRLKALDLEILELENQAQAHRADVTRWQDMLDDDLARRRR